MEKQTKDDLNKEIWKDTKINSHNAITRIYIWRRLAVTTARSASSLASRKHALCIGCTTCNGHNLKTWNYCRLCTRRIYTRRTFFVRYVAITALFLHKTLTLCPVQRPRCFHFHFLAVQQYIYPWYAWTWRQDDRTGNRVLQWGMLQRTRMNTIGRRSTRVRMTCRAFPLWLQRQSFLWFVRFNYQFSSVERLFVVYKS